MSRGGLGRANAAARRPLGAGLPLASRSPQVPLASRRAPSAHAATAAPQVMQCAPGSFVSFPAPVPPPAGADDGVPVATPAPRARLSDLTATVEMTVAPAYNVPFRGRDGAWW